MAGASFPLSFSRALKDWTRGQDPLDVLYPQEVEAAHLWVSQSPQEEPTAGVLRKARVFATAFREKFGFELTSKIQKSLYDNPAFRAYVKSLQHQSADAIIRRLEADGATAYQDYLDSRRMAKEAGDHKEMRLGASDHLDRIGATKKTDTVQREIVVVLRSKNFEEHDLAKTLPPIDHEIVVEKADAAE